MTCKTRLAIGLLILCVAGCAPIVPRDQIQRANAAYAAMAAQTDPLLAQLAVAERRLARDALIDTGVVSGDPDAGGPIYVAPAPSNFDPNRARYFATIGDPVLTASVRGGLSVVGAYFKVLTALADGSNVDETKAQITNMATKLAATVSLVSGTPVAPVVDGALTALAPVLQLWLQAQNDRELRRLVLDGQPQVRAVLMALRDASKTIYADLTRQLNTVILLKNSAAETRASVQKMAEANTSVANFVVALDRLDAMTAALAEAVAAPGSAVTLSALTASADDLLIEARAATVALNYLKVGAAP